MSAVNICCASIRATTRGEMSRGVEVVFSCPNHDQLDHHEVYRRYFETADLVGALTLALNEYVAIGDVSHTDKQ